MMEPRRNPEAHTCSFLRGHYLGLLASSARVKKYMKKERGKTKLQLNFIGEPSNFRKI